LKHGFDLWNSNIFLIVSDEDIPKARELLTARSCAGIMQEKRSKSLAIGFKKFKQYPQTYSFVVFY